uniref:Uncharacterized protein n=1 Tax=Pseudo-nitzschia australis TaxID=44445 RepID=A0A7S4ER34_9STRA|mmetsp:Transcript_1057/g.2461  ORF Transcript_1057/g.2461 Transcript_1057/m.2461 type:complete len:447 (+) Transcript_1057:116-1456(+)
MRSKYLQHFKVAALFFLSASLIQYASIHVKLVDLDEMLEMTRPLNSTRTSRLEIDKPNYIEDAVEKLGTRSQRAINSTRKEESPLVVSSLHYNATNASSFSAITENENIVIIQSNESFLWQGAQSRLCTRIKKKRKKQKSQKTLHLFLETNCGAIDKRNQHGNYMIGLYAMKLAAMAFQADFTFRCEESERQDFMFWWLQSKNNATTSEAENNHSSNSLYIPPQPTPNIACKGMGSVALHYTSEYVRNDLRAMATELSSSMKTKGMMIDEVAIHLRCGDIINRKLSPKDKNYGLVKFQAYRTRIPTDVKSIGIVTAPFVEKNRRKQDHGSGAMCRTLVLGLVDNLRLHFPSSDVRVRNDPSESIPEVASRLILAKYNFCIRSTFCLLPSVASYGTSFVQKGGVAYFVDDVSKVYDNIKLMDEPFLLSRDIREKGFNSTLQWLTESY